MPEGEKTQPDFASITYAVQMEVDKQVQPVLDQFDRQVTRQQEFADRFRFISPAILAQSAMNDLAGTSLGRYQHFSRQVDGFFEEWRAYFLPKIFQKTKLKAADLESFPRYSFREEEDAAITGRVGVVLAGMAAFSSVVLMVGFGRIKSARAAG